MKKSLIRVYNLYIVSGFLWGVILGFFIAYIVGAALAGVVWIFIFGDNAWPNWVWPIIYSLMVIVGFSVFFVCFFIGLKYSKKIKTDNTGQKGNPKIVLFSLTLSLVVLIIFVLYHIYIRYSTKIFRKSISEKYQKYLNDNHFIRKSK